MNHYIDFFGVKSRKEGLVKAVQTYLNVNLWECDIRIAYVGYACYNPVLGINNNYNNLFIYIARVTYADAHTRISKKNSRSFAKYAKKKSKEKGFRSWKK